MNATTKVVVELCRSNSIGSHYHEPSVDSWREVSPARAKELLAEKSPNGFFWRIAPGTDLD
jgi:hypothetical protein